MNKPHRTLGETRYGAHLSEPAPSRSATDTPHLVHWTPPKWLNYLWWWVRGVDLFTFRARCSRCGRSGQDHYLPHTVFRCFRFSLIRR